MESQAKARIIGLGSYLPERRLTNEDLEKIVDTSDDWITSRTGIKERRIARDDEATSDMAIEAGKIALEKARVNPEEIELVIVATSTPDYPSSSSAAIVQAKLGLNNTGAVDVQAACTGFLYGLSIAKAYVDSGMYRKILLIASEKMSTYIDYTDRTTCVLFGDGASAAVVTDEGPGFLIDHVDLGADGNLSDLIVVPAGGTRQPTTKDTVEKRMHYLKMQGREVFKHAVRRMVAAVQKCLEKTSLKEEDISWLVPHQANERIIDAIAKQFHIPMEKVYKTVRKYGNNSSPSVSIALDELTQEERLKIDEHLLLVAFGAGLTWGALILKVVE